MRIPFPRPHRPSASRATAGTTRADKAGQTERIRLIENLIRDFDRETQDAIRRFAATACPTA